MFFLLRLEYLCGIGGIFWLKKHGRGDSISHCMFHFCSDYCWNIFVVLAEYSGWQRIVGGTQCLISCSICVRFVVCFFCSDYGWNIFVVLAEYSGWQSTVGGTQLLDLSLSHTDSTFLSCIHAPFLCSTRIITLAKVTSLYFDVILSFIPVLWAFILSVPLM